MQRIRIERKASFRDVGDRYTVLPLDPRDPDILRAKRLLREPDERAAPGSDIAPIGTAYPRCLRR